MSRADAVEVSDERVDATRDGISDDMAVWTACIAGALTRTEFEHALSAAGFVGVEITETKRVHESAGAAIMRAAMPRD